MNTADEAEDADPPRLLRPTKQELRRLTEPLVARYLESGGKIRKAA
jgi:hypothetical protein